MLMITLLAVSSLLLHVEAVDRETKSVVSVGGGGLGASKSTCNKLREAFKGGVASVSQLMNKFNNPNEKDFEFGHRANNMYYLPPAPSKFASIDARVGLITLTQFTFQ